MFIKETDMAFEVDLAPVVKNQLFDIRQQGGWIQIDKRQATQLIAVLQKLVDGGEVE